MWAFFLPILFVLQTVAFAQATPPANLSEDSWALMLKVMFPPMWTVLGPMLNRGVTWGLLKVVSSVPQWAQVIVSGMISAVIAGAAGAIPEFPLTIESAATIGATSGAAGQVLLHKTMGPIQGEPGTLKGTPA